MHANKESAIFIQSFYMPTNGNEQYLSHHFTPKHVWIYNVILKQSHTVLPPIYSYADFFFWVFLALEKKINVCVKLCLKLYMQGILCIHIYIYTCNTKLKQTLWLSSIWHLYDIQSSATLMLSVVPVKTCRYIVPSLISYWRNKSCKTTIFLLIHIKSQILFTFLILWSNLGKKYGDHHINQRLHLVYIINLLDKIPIFSLVVECLKGTNEKEIKMNQRCYFAWIMHFPINNVWLFSGVRQCIQNYPTQ